MENNAGVIILCIVVSLVFIGGVLLGGLQGYNGMQEIVENKADDGSLLQIGKNFYKIEHVRHIYVKDGMYYPIEPEIRQKPSNQF